jgi:hypothetical protein
MGSHQKNEGDLFVFQEVNRQSKFAPYFQMPREKFETVFKNSDIKKKTPG